jgi:hypothetical protein
MEFFFEKHIPKYLSKDKKKKDQGVLKKHVILALREKR